MRRRGVSDAVVTALIFFVLAIATRAAEPATSSPAALKASVTKALALLKKGAEGHVAERACFACHNQGIPILAFATAQERGFTVPDLDMKEQLRSIAAFLEGNRENYKNGKGQGGDVNTAGYALLALDVGGWKADVTTEAIVEYLLLRDKDLDHWRTTSQRPPSEASNFTANYLAIRALAHWGVPAQKLRIDKRVVAVRAWLRKKKAVDTEDRVFRLWALRAAGAGDNDILPAIGELTRGQRKDGGWGQTEAMDSDAYATGSALVALHEAGSMSAGDPIFKRGTAFLLETQRKDGSWLVHSRSRPFQTYFESGFPHGKDQFISMAATAWATTALALTNPRTCSGKTRRDFPAEP
jgi:hypothetical protein